MPGSARFRVISGDPGTAWTNDTSRIMQQLHVKFDNSCAVCISQANMIAPYWPLPFHFGCNCRNVPIVPGATASPFIDFADEIRKLEPSGQAAAMGASNWRLVEAGVVKFEDVVTRARIRDFHEVVSIHKLSAKTMTDAGVRSRWAKEAHERVNTAKHLDTEATRRALIVGLRNAGLSESQIAAEVGSRLVVRVGIKGPSGQGGLSAPPRPKPAPKPPPAPKQAAPKPVETPESKRPVEVVKSTEGLGDDSSPVRKAVEYKSIPDPSGKGGADWGKAHWDDWAKTLATRDRQAVSHYTRSGFKQVNAYLRKPPENPTKFDLMAKMEVEALDKVFETAPGVPDDILVYRGFGLEALGMKYDEIKPGIVLRDVGFTSTSIDERTVGRFGGGNKVRAEIRVPKGTKAVWVNSVGGSQPEERELLLDRKVDEFVVVETHPDRIIFEARSSNVQR